MGVLLGNAYLDLLVFLNSSKSTIFAARQQGKKWKGNTSTFQMLAVTGNERRLNNTTHHFPKYFKMCPVKSS